MDNLERVLSKHIDGGPGAWKSLYDDLTELNGINERRLSEKKEFALLVDEMRRNQKKFFETKDRYYLKFSMQLEKKVDAEIVKILDPKPEQQDLWP